MYFFFSSRRRHTRCSRDWSSDVCSSDLGKRKRPHRPRPERRPGRDRGARASEQECGKSAHVVDQRRPESRADGPVWPAASAPSPCLLQFDDRALCFELLFDVFGFLLGHAFLHRAGRAFHQVLGLLQAQAGDRPDFLDHLNLLLPATLEDDRELGLLLRDRKSTRLNSSHGYISYAVFCLKKKTK